MQGYRLPSSRLLVPAPPPVIPRCLPLCLSSLHPPPAAGRSCSIPAGPGLFISSEVLMINETLNTSSVSLGPGEPPQLSKQAPAAALQSRHWAWSAGELTPHPTHPQVAIRKTRREFDLTLQKLQLLSFNKKWCTDFRFARQHWSFLWVNGSISVCVALQPNKFPQYRKLSEI